MSDMRAESFGKSSGGCMLWNVSTLADRVSHALKLRNMKRGHLDEELARRLGKKGRGSGYTYRVVEQGHQPRPENLKAIADILRVSHRWLLTGQGAIEPEGSEVATYDSLPGWAVAAAEEGARRRVADYAIRAAGRSPAFVVPERIDADFVYDCAMFWLRYAPERDRIAVMAAEVERIKAEGE